MRRKTHRTIKKVTEDFDGGFHFNTAISAIMELVNETYNFMTHPSGSSVLNEAVETIVTLLSPLVPHIAEELWQALGKKNSIFKTAWPAFDRDAITEDTMTMVIQLNGKVRSKIDVPSAISDEELKSLVLADDKIRELTRGREVKRMVIVPKKLVNIVV